MLLINKIYKGIDHKHAVVVEKMNTGTFLYELIYAVFYTKEPIEEEIEIHSKILKVLKKDNIITDNCITFCFKISGKQVDSLRLMIFNSKESDVINNNKI